MVASPTPEQIRIVASVGIPVAMVSTCLRLFIRARKRKLWWDDFTAFVSMLGIIFFLVGIYIFTDPPQNHTQSVKIFANYSIDVGFYATIWPARVSILFTVIRLVIGKFRRMLKYVVAAFLITWAVLAAQGFWTCEENVDDWKHQEIAQCVLGPRVAIAQLITDCLADLILIVAPIYLLSTLNTMRGLRIRLMLVFSCSIFTTVFSLVHAYAILHKLGFLEFMFALVEIIVSLIVVNLSVIVSWIFKLTDEVEQSGPSHYVNTFLREGRSGGGGGRRSKAHDITTIGLSTFSPAHVEITREVDTDDKLGKPAGAAGHIELPLNSSGELEDRDGNSSGKGGMDTYNPYVVHV